MIQGYRIETGGAMVCIGGFHLRIGGTLSTKISVCLCVRFD